MESGIFLGLCGAVAEVFLEEDEAVIVEVATSGCPSLDSMLDFANG